MHECEWCGQICDCDMDDMMGPQPEDCACEHESMADPDEWDAELDPPDELTEGPLWALFVPPDTEKKP